MNTTAIEHDFKEKVSQSVGLVAEGLKRYRVSTPFLFEDGDHLKVVLKQEGKDWILSDEGSTYFHLTYDVDEKDLQKGTRQKIISNTLSMFAVTERDGELVIPVKKRPVRGRTLFVRSGFDEDLGRQLSDARTGPVNVS